MVEETRRKILDAATEVFAEYGFFKAPVDLVAERAGVSKGLIFWYFRRKDDLVIEVASKALPRDVMEACLNSNLTGSELLKCIGERYLEKYSDPKMRNLMLHAMSATSSYKQLAELLEHTCGKLLREVALRAFGDAGTRELAKVRAFFGALLCYSLHRPADLDPREYVKTLVTILGPEEA